MEGGEGGVSVEYRSDRGLIFAVSSSVAFRWLETKWICGIHSGGFAAWLTLDPLTFCEIICSNDLSVARFTRINTSINQCFVPRRGTLRTLRFTPVRYAV